VPDQEAAAWMLHANLYMNAKKVYTGTEQYQGSLITKSLALLT
jgi:hypothetical protein